VSAPTEAEIRATIEAAWGDSPRDDPRDKLAQAVEAFAQPIRWKLNGIELAADEAEFAQLGDALWKDLRPSESVRLLDLLYEAEQRALERAQETIMGEYTAAALAFAAEFPDAPRAENVAA